MTETSFYIGDSLLGFRKKSAEVRSDFDFFVEFGGAGSGWRSVEA
jgi:hypothetical protein